MSHSRPYHLNLLQEWFPNTKLPILISGPMLGVSNGSLASAVSRAGGFGLIPGGADFTPGSAHLTSLEKELQVARENLGLSEMTLTPAPVGVGFLTFDESVGRFKENVVPILERYLPQAVWLFAPDDPESSSGTEGGSIAGGGAGRKRAHPDIIAALREHGIKVFVQVGTVAAAREAIQDGADVVVAQGIDAGGHQFAAGCGVISLVPEIKAMIVREFKDREIGLVAAGGIVEASGVVAAIALGADAVVMGTRFIVSKESSATQAKKQLLISTVDGGANTVKATFHDEVKGPNKWPARYDGRAIIGQSYTDYKQGKSVAELQEALKAADASGDISRQTTWSGTGVGLITEELPAGDIVRMTRDAAKQRLQAMQGVFDDEGKAPKDKNIIKELGRSLYRHR